MPRSCSLLSFTNLSATDAALKVIAPVGGAGNHVRWLLFLNLEFNCEIGIDERQYIDVSGPDWPPYSDYKQKSFVPSDLLLADPLYIENCTKLCLDNIDARAEFIKSEIYTNDRTWHNWLNYEWRSREEFSKIIGFAHDHQNRPDDSRRLIVTMDPELALRSYIKMNTSLNNWTMPVFLDKVRNFNRTSNSMPESDKYLVVNADSLWQDTLPIEFYETITNWLGTSGNYYKQTNEIHQCWFNLHRRAELDIVEYFQNLYGG